jgi:hypothetical protein
MFASSKQIGTAWNGFNRLNDSTRAALLIVGLFLTSRIVMYCIFGAVQADFSLGTFAQSLCKWDCGWYTRTIRDGYDLTPRWHYRGDAANWAFFPLYPLIATGLAKILSVSPLVAGLLVSNTAALASGFIAAKILPNIRGLLAFCVILYLGPFSFYFASVYTESLFVFLTLTCFYLLSRRQYLAAAAVAALLSGTRAVGVFMVLTILVSALRDHLADNGSLKSFPRAALSNPQLTLAIFLAPIGLFAYMAYLHYHMGDALAFSHIQRAWGRVIDSPLKVLARGLLTNDLHLLFDGGMSRRWCAIWSVTGLVLTGYLLSLRRFPEAVFAFICILIPLSTGLDSMPRYVVGTAPLLIIASELMASRRSILAFAVPGLIIANVPLLVLWVRGAGFLI